MTGSEDLWLTLEVRNESLNPGTQLVHPTSLAKMAKVILAPGHLRIAEAVVDLSSKLVFICFLIYLG